MTRFVVRPSNGCREVTFTSTKHNRNEQKKYIWSAKRSIPKAIFFLNRYVPFASSTMIFISERAESVGYRWVFTFRFSSACHPSVGTSGVSSSILVIGWIESEMIHRCANGWKTQSAVCASYSYINKIGFQESSVTLVVLIAVQLTTVQGELFSAFPVISFPPAIRRSLQPNWFSTSSSRAFHSSIRRLGTKQDCCRPCFGDFSGAFRFIFFAKNMPRYSVRRWSWFPTKHRQRLR